jgi:hypothetical protein
VPALRARTIMLEFCATTSSMPVPTSGISEVSSGTAWRCMFEPISARFASSCSRNGISDAENADDLLRADVHVVDLLRVHEGRVALDARDDAALVVADELAGLVDVGVGRRQDRGALLVTAQAHDLGLAALVVEILPPLMTMYGRRQKP